MGNSVHSGDVWIAYTDLRLGIVGSGSFSTSVVGWKGTTGAQGSDVELGVLSVLGGEIRAQSNLLVRLDDFLRNQRVCEARSRAFGGLGGQMGLKRDLGSERR